MVIKEIPENEGLIHELAAAMYQLGMLHERGYRDCIIRIEYQRLRSEGYTQEKAEKKLSEKFSSKKHKLEPESVHSIIYKDRK